ncbi:MAG TPA: response regulator [Nitrososphaeraceae archaeon]|nr:response regulator [Nitrososphaeraceae archaeon]
MANYETIAILESDTDTSNLYSISLYEFGYSVKEFSNPESLLEYVQSNPSDIGFLIMEYEIKQMTGCEVASEVNSINPRVKMAFVTGYDGIMNNKLELEIIKKPIKLTQMIKLARKYMNGKKMIQ